MELGLRDLNASLALKTEKRESSSEPPSPTTPRAEELGAGASSDAGEREMRDLEDLLSNLNPMNEQCCRCAVEE
jgi:hypothetical protein